MGERSGGILLHISSLPGDYGIGDFGEGAYEFVDFLVQSGQAYWQILPIGITGYGDSPYQSFSAFAGNPYFIDLNEFISLGFLDEKKVRKVDFGKNRHKVDYEKLYYNKMPLLKEAYSNARIRIKHELDRFAKEQGEWLERFAAYMAIKEHNDGRSWLSWPIEYRNSDGDAIEAFKQSHEDEIGFWIFTQYYFFKQWFELKAVANHKGIRIIGDLPIYVAEDSADVWGNPELFKLDKEGKPMCVAGCPPDAFSATGQLWGNPIYDWDKIKQHDFAWWVERIDYSLKLFDVIRIDHFRGFDAYWEIPYGDKTAENGKWIKGPGLELFKAIEKKLGKVNIIAEDLGFLTDSVIELRKATGFPGMKVLEFAFDTREDSDYLPHNYEKNCIAYTGTHDNDTVIGWMDSVVKGDREYAVDYLKLDKHEGYNWGFIRGIWSSSADISIAQMQDFLGLDSKARMNTPSTLGGNWQFRITEKDLTKALSRKIRHLTELYGRLK